MQLEQWISTLKPAIETELQRVINLAGSPGMEELRSMMRYHMGWEGEGAGPGATGKRIRPLLVLLTAAAAGGQWENALPAAAAVELVHNFSLIHDDIEDQSSIRRRRLTMWKIWGVPQAINTGDAMFTLAHISLLRLEDTTSPEIALKAAGILQRTCLHLTQGQFLDISYEARGDLTLDAYLPMITGKTAALLAACTDLGALAAGASDPVRQTYRSFGQSLGLAFQAQDDYLGIWGDAEVTGKSAESDLLSGKKSLPVLYGLARQGPFASRWEQDPITPAEVPDLARQLADEGALAYTQEMAGKFTQQALQALQEAKPQGEPGQALLELAQLLLNRKS